MRWRSGGDYGGRARNVTLLRQGTGVVTINNRRNGLERVVQYDMASAYQ
jgi:hypothetical protein